MKRAVVILVFVSAWPVRGASRGEHPICGSYPGRLATEMAKHRDLDGRRPPRQALQNDAGEAVGNIALVAADASILADPNFFDLDGTSLGFQPLNGEASRYRKEPDGAALEPALGQTIGLGDDDSRSVELSFEFPFFGRRYRQVFVNSDGNLTFGAGDNASTDRSLDRTLSGPPRIALFFADLDPQSGGQVRVASFPDRFAVTWDAVPEFGTSNRNTFQVVVEPSGRISFRYGAQVDASAAIAGISGGGSSPETNLIDLTGDPFEGSGAILERFVTSRTVDNVAAVRRFYQSFGDSFDQVVVWTNFESDLDDAFAFELTVQNDVQGIGVNRFNESRDWGSSGRLQSLVQMGNLRRYPANPEFKVGRAGGTPTTLGLLAHESGHRFLAVVRFDRQGARSDDLLGRQLAHWSFFLDSDGSFMEGNDIEEQSPGLYRTVDAVSRYSNLDLYIMGLAPPAEVAPMFYVTSQTGNREASPQVGITFSGNPTTVMVDDIIRAEGPRRPDFGGSPKAWRQAWILLYRPEIPPTEGEIAQLEAARAAWEPFFNEKTLGRGTMGTSLAR